VSAAGRSAVRRADDFYETPGFCVHRLLEAVDLPGGVWVEPSAGHGAIITAVNSFRSDVKWAGFEIRPEARPYLVPLVFNTGSMTKDFLATIMHIDEPAVVIGNPPFSLAKEFVMHALAIAPYVAMLLRLNFIGSAKRSAFFRSDMPDVYVLPNRPSFTGGGTDATEYAWCVWTPERGRRSGRVEVLAETPLEERR
jgi:hypothetical protein